MKAKYKDLTREQKDAFNAYTRKRRANMSVEQKEAVKEYVRAYGRKRYANQTAEQKEARNARARARRANRTPEQKAAENARNAARTRSRRANRTPEQKAAENARDAAYQRRRLANLTPEQKEADSNRRREKYINRTPEQVVATQNYLRKQYEKNGEALRARRREWYRNCSPEQKAKIRERNAVIRLIKQADAREKKYGFRRLLTSEERSQLARQRVKDFDSEGKFIVISRHKKDSRVKTGIATNPKKRYSSTNWVVLRYAPVHTTGVVEAVSHVRMGVRTYSGQEEEDYDPRHMELGDAFDVIDHGEYWQRSKHGGENGYTEATDRWTEDEVIELVDRTVYEIDGEYPEWIVVKGHTKDATPTHALQ